MSKLWTVIANVAAIIISITAATFTGIQCFDAHSQLNLTKQQLAIATRPLVDFDTEDEKDDPPVGIAIMNDGLGPAIIKSLTYYVDRKPVKDWTEAAQIGHINADHLTYFELEENDALAVNAKHWLIQYRKRDLSRKELSHFEDFIDDHLAIQATYCSQLGECWTKCSTLDRC